MKKTTNTIASLDDLNKITFTRFTNTRGPASKRYWLENGALKKEAAAQIAVGIAERMTIPFADFAKALGKATKKQAFGYGMHSLSYPDTVNIAVKGKEKPEYNIIARSQENFEYIGAGVVMIDHDPSDYGKRYSPDETLAAIISVHPEIAQAARIVRGSVSAGVHLDGEAPRTDKGFHIYMPVSDTTGLEEYGKIITQRLWLAGHGFIALAKNGAMLERTCIDAAVFSPERLDFVGEPVISGTGLSYTPVDVFYKDGGMLDIATLPKLSDEELAKINTIKSAAKAAIKPESEKK